MLCYFSCVNCNRNWPMGDLILRPRAYRSAICISESGMDTGRIDPRVGSGQNILNALCEFCSFCGVSDLNCNEMVLHYHISKISVSLF